MVNNLPSPELPAPRAPDILDPRLAEEQGYMAEWAVQNADLLRKPTHPEEKK